MDQKSSTSVFSLAELRDLFTLDEETDCQTHDLLGCVCQGRGGTGSLKSGGGSGGPEGADGTEDGNGVEMIEDDSEGEPDTLPADILPGLIKASQVDMVKIEEVSFPQSS